MLNQNDKNAPVRVGIIGLGTVGQGFLRLLLNNQGIIRERLGFPLTLGGVCEKNPETLKGLSLPPDCVIYRDWEEMVRDPRISLVVELVGGLDPARTLILEAMKAGKSVVTANKALLAKHGEEIFGSAAAHGV
ncbi:MAG: Homoserine dehydrogenase, partial [Leptospirillum sp. Group IV 'UBA BS']